MKSKNSYRWILCSVIMLSCYFGECYAQKRVFVKGVEINSQPIEYVQISGVGELLKSTITVKLDYGQKMKWELSESDVITDETGKPIAFESMVGALNFMSENGWEFLSLYTVLLGSDATNQSTHVHYLLRKKKEK